LDIGIAMVGFQAVNFIGAAVVFAYQGVDSIAVNIVSTRCQARTGVTAKVEGGIKRAWG